MTSTEFGEFYSDILNKNFSSYFPPFRPVLLEDTESPHEAAVPMDQHPANPLMPIDILPTSKNGTSAGLPTFDNRALTVVIVYCFLFVVAAVGNLTVFITLFKSRRRKSRISLMILHLSVADLMVTFIMIPLEVGWRISVSWLAGNAACKVFLFLRAFGLYLSSNVLVCVSLDRYFAVLHPLRVTDARRRGRVMLACAWGVSLVCSFPQSVVFHVMQHPDDSSFEQCVAFGFFSSVGFEIAYNLFCVAAVYLVPLLIISVAYTCILCEISKKSRETRDLDNEQPNSTRLHLRRSDIRNIERARSRTLRMTITIVSVFVWCWMPYVVMTLWYMFDRESAEMFDKHLQDYFFIMAVSNSCMNPLVYGSYALNIRKEWRRLGSCLRPQSHRRKSTDRSATTKNSLAVNAVHRQQCGPIPIAKKIRIVDGHGSVYEHHHCVTIHSDPCPQPERLLSRSSHPPGLLTTRSLDNNLAPLHQNCYHQNGYHQNRWR